MSTTVKFIATNIGLTANGYELDTSSKCFGELRSSIDVVNDVGELRTRMRNEGYLYLPGYLDRDLVLETREVIVNRLAEEGFLDPRFPPMEAVAREGSDLKFKPDLANDNRKLEELLYSGRMMDFFSRFFGELVLHFDFTWMRAVAPGTGTPPHGDSVFMNRGTQNLYTAWTPLGDVSLEVGGLMILEDSHSIERLKNTYLRKDVDSYCSNRRNAELYASGDKSWGGYLSKNAVSLREKLGGRWLTTEFRAGDLLTFGMSTIHASLDNHSNTIRLSSDSRYQPASEPADERWVGENPIGHSAAGKQGRIC